MDRAKKAIVVDERNKAYGDTEAIVVARNDGLDAAVLTAIRVGARANGVDYKVSKNRLVLRALKGTRFEGIGHMLKGPIAIATSKDPVAAAKVLCGFAKNNEKLVIIGGALGDKVLDKAAIEALSKLPSLDELRGRFVGLLQTPAQRLATLAQAPAGQLARVLQAYADKG